MSSNTALPPGASPDSLTFFLIQNYASGSLYNGTGSSQVPTTDPNSTLFTISITPSPSNPNNPTITTYGPPSNDSGDPFSPQVEVAPEPSTLMLALTGVLGLIGGTWRRRKRAA